MGDLVDLFALDLRGLEVYTEAASGPYLLTPLLAAQAGATVTAVTRDSPYGTATDVREATLAAADGLGLGIRVVLERSRDDLARADIVTNAGFVRPIDTAVVSWLKPTAVVPLMWETWEWRPGELDLDACRERGILVLGTDESQGPAPMYGYGGAIAMKLLFELGIEVYRTSVLLIGGGRGLGEPMASMLEAAGAAVTWFSSGPDDGTPYELLSAHWAAHGSDYDVCLVAEHADPRLLLGPGGLIEFDALVDVNPGLRVGVVSGNVDPAGLAMSGLRHHPQRIRPVGHMSYQAADLGPRPVLELFAAGLKVGQEMARARLEGLGVDDARARALALSPAMDFV